MIITVGFSLRNEHWNRSPELTVAFPLAEGSGANKWTYTFWTRNKENRLS